MSNVDDADRQVATRGFCDLGSQDHPDCRMVASVGGAQNLAGHDVHSLFSWLDTTNHQTAVSTLTCVKKVSR